MAIPILLAALFVLVNHLLNPAPPRLSVFPAVVEFPPAESNRNFIFTVRNNTDEDHYEPEFKFKIAPTILSTTDFDMHIPKTSLKPSFDGSPASDMCGLYVRDGSNSAAFLVQIWRLAPHEVREITFTNLTSQRATVRAMTSNAFTTARPRSGTPLEVGCHPFADEVFHNDGEFFVMMDGTRKELPPAK